MWKKPKTDVLRDGKMANIIPKKKLSITMLTPKLIAKLFTLLKLLRLSGLISMFTVTGANI